MERRVLLAISLSFLVLFLYQAFVMPPAPPETPGNVTAPQTAGGGQPSSLAAANQSAATPTLAPVPEAALVGESSERDIVVETQKVKAVFTNRGARLKDWLLKDFKADSGEPLDLVPGSATTLPFTLKLDDAAAAARLNGALYRVTGTSGPTVDGTAQNVTVTFDTELTDGWRVRKMFAFEPQSYVITVTTTVHQGTQAVSPELDWGPGLGYDIAQTPPGSFFSPNYIYKAQGILYADGSVERIPGISLGPGNVREGQFRWVGVDDHYFLSAILQPPVPLRAEFHHHVMPTTGTPPLSADYVSYAVKVPVGVEGLRYYIGPKQFDIMQPLDPEFTRAIYFGMFDWLAVPLLKGLKWVHGYVRDWGWSIIVLTILINLAMFPLRHKSVVSMRRMQELQPQMKAIQDRYAKYKITDPERQKMNTEVMELYRARGVNPASGCVPMLLTMPFLFAFYAMLGQAIEIRGEGFLNWIPDLSRADPFYITPMLMGLTMFWQMKIQPTTADPTQQKVMMFMPVMVTVTMLFAPAGLVIYWLVSNVWAIGQQYFTNYLIGPPKVHNVRPPAMSKAKDSGGKSNIS
jgi:YidC/Oxa1 family membrane protein insertase